MVDRVAEPSEHGPAGPRRRGRLARTLAVLVGGGLAGLAVAAALNAALGIEFLDREPPPEPQIDASRVTAVAPFEPVTGVVVPAGDEWLRRGAERLADALQLRTGERPVLVASRDEAPDGRIIVVGEVDADGRVDDPQGFALAATEDGLTLAATDRQGHVGGVYWLADRVLTGAAERDLDDQVVVPALARRLVDMGGLGVPQDPDTWDPTNYSHDVRNLHEAVLPGPPYVDPDAFARVESDLVDYLDLMRAYGNNGIVHGAFLDLIDFDLVGDGTQVYAADSPYRERHETLREHLGRLWTVAEDAGMEIYLGHSQLALTPPLEAYLRDQLGELDTEDPRLWEVYQAGLAELFERFEELDGIVIRIGEAGSIYDPEDGLEYTTRLEVRTDEAVRAMLTAFLEVAEAYDRDIVFRSWTVGIGEVGHLHHRADVYERVLSELDSPNLVVSTKYVQGDFYRYIPFNETLLTGDHRRIVEVQNRLEFEGFMAFPNLIGPLHGAALSHFVAGNNQVEGVWQWNQMGGPQQAGPMSLYPFHGFWAHIDANAYTTSRHAFDLDADPTDVAADWVRRSFGSDPAVVAPLTEVLSRSREAAAKGLYVSAFAEQLVLALGLETTPMMWIFEWDIVSGSSSVLSTTYYTARDDVDAAVAEGEEAAALAREMAELAAGVDPALVTDPELLAAFVASLDHQVDLFETLAAWRATFLEYHRWLDTGDATARSAWRTAAADFELRRAAHVERYGGDLDFPAYSFFAVERGMAHAERTEAMAWLARGLLALLVVVVAVGGAVLAGWLPRRPGTAAAAALTSALVRPGADHGLASAGRGEWLLAVALPAGWLAIAFLTFSSFESVHYPTLIALVVVVFAGVLTATAPRARHAVLVGLAAPLLALVGALMAVVAVRGPGLVWYRFWTDAGSRTWFVALTVVLLVWLVHAVVATLRHAGATRLAAAGGVLAAGGATLLAVGVVPALVGLERMLTGLNDELAVLPLGLSRILGITVHLDIPTALPIHLVVVGTATGLAGSALLWAGRRRSAPAATDTDRHDPARLEEISS